MVDFTIGCELEVTMELLPVFAAQQHFNDLAEFTEFVVSKYEKNRGPNDIAVQSDLYGAPEVENRWNLTDDITIDTSSPKQWPIEIVSPVFFHRSDGEWMTQIRTLFQNLNRVCFISTNPSCGFHVHFAPVGGWNPDTVKAISRAILFFEPAFEVILPKERRGNEYAKSNRHDNSRLKGKSGNEIFQAISNCTHSVQVADLMNDGGDRYNGWNFTNLYQGRIQTVEFRRGPGVSTYGQCVAWIELVVCFARASLRFDTSKLLQHSQDVAGLWRFITEDCPAADVEVMRPIFHGKSGSLAPKHVRDLTPAEQEKLEKKKLQADAKNIMSMKMKLLFES